MIATTTSAVKGPWPASCFCQYLHQVLAIIPLPCGRVWGRGKDAEIAGYSQFSLTLPIKGEEKADFLKQDISETQQ
jgi:hypothetical protein